MHWTALHEASQAARRFADVALSCVDRPNPDMLAKARDDLDTAAVFAKTKEPKWQVMNAGWERELSAQKMARRPAMPRRERTIYVSGGRGAGAYSGGGARWGW